MVIINKKQTSIKIHSSLSHVPFPNPCPIIFLNRYALFLGPSAGVRTTMEVLMLGENRISLLQQPFNPKILH